MQKSPAGKLEVRLSTALTKGRKRGSTRLGLSRIVHTLEPGTGWRCPTSHTTLLTPSGVNQGNLRSPVGILKKGKSLGVFGSCHMPAPGLQAL